MLVCKAALQTEGRTGFCSCVCNETSLRPTMGTISPGPKVAVVAVCCPPRAARPPFDLSKAKQGRGLLRRLCRHIWCPANLILKTRLGRLRSRVKSEQDVEPSSVFPSGVSVTLTD